MRSCAVIFGFVMAGPALWTGALRLHAQDLVQTHKRKESDKGPRAIGLVQLSDKGKARLIPIVIMLDGKFYDAGSYKADPVPMALDFGVVYEGFRSGVSQGIFTITQPGQLSHNWIAEGTWLPAGAKAPEKFKKYAPPVIDEGERDDRPVLHRRSGGETDKDESKPAKDSTGAAPTTPATASAKTPPAGSSGTASAGSTPSQPSTSSTSTSTPPPGSTSGPASTPTDASTKAAAPAATKTADSSDYAQPLNDPNRPVLRRGKPDPSAHHEPFVNFDDPAEAAKAATDASQAAAAATPSVTTVAAISDAGGPDPRPYTYELKPAEEAIYRNKMLELAAQQLRPKSQAAAQQTSSAESRAKSSAKKGTTASTSTARGKSGVRKNSAKTAQPLFEDLKLRIFDLSSSNEPVLVLSARTALPAVGTAGHQVPQEITLIARTNLEGELQKLFYAQTDSRHLDVSPRMDLIDAVDADGDGRGELLFRQTSDAGSVYAIYRVTANGLWSLYAGAP